MVFVSEGTIQKCQREILKVLQENTNNSAEAQAILDQIDIAEYSKISLGD